MTSSRPKRKTPAKLEAVEMPKKIRLDDTPIRPDDHDNKDSVNTSFVVDDPTKVDGNDLFGDGPAAASTSKNVESDDIDVLPVLRPPVESGSGKSKSKDDEGDKDKSLTRKKGPRCPYASEVTDFDPSTAKYPKIRELMDKIEILPFVGSVTSSGNNTPGVGIPRSSVEGSFVSKKVREIDNILIHPGTKKLINIAMADPEHFERKGLWVVYKDSGKIPTFFLMGTVAFSQLDRTASSKQICLAPFDCVWPRTTAFIGSLYGDSMVYFSTFNQGISFSTIRSKAGGSSSSSPKNIVSPGKVVASAFEPVLPANAKVPYYDGSDGFLFEKYTSLRQLKREPLPGSAVVVGFTLGAYAMTANKQPGGIRDLTYVMSTNIQFVILVEDHDHRSNGGGVNLHELWGTTAPSGSPEVTEDDADEDDDEDDYGELL